MAVTCKSALCTRDIWYSGRLQTSAQMLKSTKKELREF